MLKKIAEKYLDKKYINRRKMGFSIPKYSWLIEKNNYKYIKSIINRDTSLDSIMKRSTINDILLEFESGNKDHSNRVWQLLTYQIWDGLFVSKIYSSTQKLSDL